MSAELRVLILDDVAEDAELLARELRKGDVAFTPTFASDREAFVRILRSEPPEIVLADYHLPRMDGTEAIGLVKTFCPGVPVIIVSGALGDEAAVETIRQGAVDYILKDRPQRLVSAVHRAVAEAELAQERARLSDDLASRAAQLEQANLRLGRANHELELRASELDKLARDLEESNQDLREFAYAASHDLSEPLRAIAGPIGLLASRYRDQLDSNADTYIGFVLDACERMRKMIEGLRVYSQVGRVEEAFRPVDCNAVMNTVVRVLGSQIAESGASVTADQLPTVTAEPSQLARVFQNLVSNALKFVAPGVRPEVTVSAERVGAEWRFTVSDNGIGVPPQHRDRIFVMFKRLSTREEYPGTGLGTTLAKKIVERHGGRIGVEDNASRNGSRFWFTLPA